MSGTLEGGRKAALKNKEKYGEDFYKIQGAKGGKASNTGGFASMDRERLIAISKKGGSAPKTRRRV